MFFLLSYPVNLAISYSLLGLGTTVLSEFLKCVIFFYLSLCLDLHEKTHCE